MPRISTNFRVKMIRTLTNRVCNSSFVPRSDQISVHSSRAALPKAAEDIYEERQLKTSEELERGRLASIFNPESQLTWNNTKPWKTDLEKTDNLLGWTPDKAISPSSMQMTFMSKDHPIAKSNSKSKKLSPLI
ncbi:hypothetical protein PMAYCL1PPCAC_14779, partial [Pristionchus mayeri]